MNETNLIPLNKRAKSEQREIQVAGGKASGEARREKKRLKEIISELLELDAPAMDTMFLDDYKLDVCTNTVIIAVKLVSLAKAGDIRAVKLLLELLGELEKGKVIVNNNVENFEENELYKKGFWAGQQNVFSAMTDAELIAFRDRLEKGEAIPDEEKPLILPDGRMILGVSELE